MTISILTIISKQEEEERVCLTLTWSSDWYRGTHRGTHITGRTGMLISYTPPHKLSPNGNKVIGGTQDQRLPFILLGL